VYLLHVTALTVAMAGLHRRTGRSLLLVMLMQASVNDMRRADPTRGQKNGE
jgi:hypothetical protein